MSNSPARSVEMIEVESLTKTYGRSKAVADVSFSISRGCAFGLIGPSGAGKTTLIRMLMGMSSATSGRARVLGFDTAIQADEVHRKVGYVPETPTAYRWMTVAQLIRFCRTFRETWNDELCQSLLQKFGLDPGKKVKHLSKGTQTKLSLLLALAFEPELLILDEPTTGLDPIIREEFLEPVLGAIRDRGCTVLFSSHTIEDVERLADRVGILLDGRFLVNSSVRDLLSKTRRVRALLGAGCAPKVVPEGTIWQHVDHQEWLLTVAGFTEETLRQLKSSNSVEHVEVVEADLNTLFKDYVKGQSVMP